MTNKKDNVFTKKKNKAAAIFKGVDNIDIEITPPPTPNDNISKNTKKEEVINIKEDKTKINVDIKPPIDTKSSVNDNLPIEGETTLKGDNTLSEKDINKDEKYDDIFNLKKVERLEIVDRNYTIKQRTIKTLTEFAKIKGVSKNSFIVDLIKIGLDEELENITPNSTFGSIGKVRKGGLFLRIPIDYDNKLEEHRAKLEKHIPDDVRLSKSEILDMLFTLLLKRFNYTED